MKLKLRLSKSQMEIVTIVFLSLVYLATISAKSFILTILYPISFLIFILIAKKFKISSISLKIILMIIVATTLSHWSSNLFGFADSQESNVISTYGDYYFSIDDSPSNTIKINDFKLYINFSSYNGNISFYTFQDYLEKLNNLRISLPDSLNISKINLTCWKGGFVQLYENENFTAGYPKEGNQHHVNFGDFKIEEGCDGVYFTLIFDGFIVPNGKFNFEADVKRFYSSNEENFIFIKGPYTCLNPCFSGQKNSEIVIGPDKIAISYPKNYFENVDASTYKILDQEFIMNMANNNVLKDIEFKRNAGISLLIGSLFLMAEVIVGFGLIIAEKKFFYTKPKRTPKDLFNASKHLYYEFNMLGESMKKLTHARDQVDINMALESFGIHARVLTDFLFNKSGREDDVLAIDYFDNSKEWERKIMGRKSIQEYLKRRVGKEIAHLTYTISTVTPVQKIWDCKKIHKEITNFFLEFLKMVHEDRLEQRLLIIKRKRNI